MRALVWIALFLVGLAGVVIPSIYLYTASKLPQLESENDLETHLRHSIEGERLSVQAGQYARDKRPVRFERPDFASYPKDLVALYISELRCPTFFQTSREEGPRWAWRMFIGAMAGAVPQGDGACERILALRLASALGIHETLERTVAANKLRAFLQKDQLVAYDLETMSFARGVVGVRDVAWSLYRKELKDMSLAELAELTLVLPVHGYYEDMRDCRNASLIKQNRNHILEGLAKSALVPRARAEQAMKAPVACLD